MPKRPKKRQGPMHEHCQTFERPQDPSGEKFFPPSKTTQLQAGNPDFSVVFLKELTKPRRAGTQQKNRWCTFKIQKYKEIQAF